MVTHEAQAGIKAHARFHDFLISCFRGNEEIKILGSLNMLSSMKSLLKEKDMCVLATASGGAPHCSLMAYVTDEECAQIYMVTQRNTRKYKNVLQNPSVSLLIDTREDHQGRRHEAKAMTVSGKCEVLEDVAKQALVKAKLLKRHPHLKEFLSRPDSAILCVRIASFLLLDGLTDACFEEF
jgi:nitroimidazol reductase NimA-like FMN-containing flavoprotein (pyridoxamine 5'-phosphate oxidase superfamily)